MCLLHRTCLGRDQLQSTSREEIATFGTVLELSSPSTMSSAYHASPSAPGTVTIQRAIRHAAHDNTQLYLSCLLPELRAHIDLLCAGVAPREQARSIPLRLLRAILASTSDALPYARAGSAVVSPVVWSRYGACARSFFSAAICFCLHAARRLCFGCGVLAPP